MLDRATKFLSPQILQDIYADVAEPYVPYVYGSGAE